LNALQSAWPQPAAPKPLDDPSGPTTTPTPGTNWGVQNAGYAVPITWPWPGYACGYKDSVWEGYGFQTGGNFSFGMNAYVYWNNGVTSNPYFLVLVSFGGNQQAPFGVDTDYCKGYSTGQLEVQGDNPVDGGGSTTVTIQMIDPYPQPPQYTVNLDVAIGGTGGKTIQSPTVGFAPPAVPDGWSFTNNSSPTGFDWLLTQTDRIDFLSDPFDQFLTWWENGYNGSYAIGPTDAGGSTVSYQFIGIWQVNMPSSYAYKQGDPPPATGVALLNFPSLTYSTTGYLIHSSVDCEGCYNSDDGDSEYCLWYGTPSNTQSWTIDLGQIASQNS
jgi:hypothetical protein